jgi:hypothetical protein
MSEKQFRAWLTKKLANAAARPAERRTSSYMRSEKWLKNPPHKYSPEKLILMVERIAEEARAICAKAQPPML